MLNTLHSTSVLLWGTFVGGELSACYTATNTSLWNYHAAGMLLRRLLANLPTPRHGVVHWWPLSLAGAATSIIFVATNTTKHVFCRDKSMFVTTKVCWSRQKYVGRDKTCRDKHNLVATKVYFMLCLSRQILLSRQKWYLWQLPPITVGQGWCWVTARV